MTGDRPDRTGDDWQDTRTEFRFPLLALGLTTGVSGLVDAFTLLRYGVFTANQAGNVVHIGMGLGGAFPGWPAALASVAGFGAGAVLGGRLRKAARLPPPAAELIGVIAAATLWSVADLVLDSGTDYTGYRALLTAVSALVLGILARLFLRTAGVRTTTTYQTGTVLSVADGLARWIRGGGRPGRATRTWLLGLLGIGCYAAGGALGAVVRGWPAAVFALTVAALATLLVIVRPGPRRAGALGGPR